MHFSLEGDSNVLDLRLYWATNIVDLGPIQTLIYGGVENKMCTPNDRREINIK
jgi:hypothetical protein